MAQKKVAHDPKRPRVVLTVHAIAAPDGRGTHLAESVKMREHLPALIERVLKVHVVRINVIHSVYPISRR